MGVGIAAALQTVTTSIDVPGTMERGDDLSTEIGVYVALAGAGRVGHGAGLLAKEVEGDPEQDTTSMSAIRPCANQGWLRATSRRFPWSPTCAWQVGLRMSAPPRSSWCST